MKQARFAFLSLAALTAAVAQSPRITPTTLKGVLHTGIVAIGGETTGRVLEYTVPPGQQKKIEVEVTPQTVGAGFVTDGARVVVTGPIVVRHYLERGDVPRIVASEIKPDKIAEQ